MLAAPARAALGAAPAPRGWPSMVRNPRAARVAFYGTKPQRRPEGQRKQAVGAGELAGLAEESAKGTGELGAACGVHVCTSTRGALQLRLR